MAIRLKQASKGIPVHFTYKGLGSFAITPLNNTSKQGKTILDTRPAHRTGKSINYKSTISAKRDTKYGR